MESLNYPFESRENEGRLIKNWRLISLIDVDAN